jgi:hypothetical protein
MMWFFINPGRKGYVYYHDDDDDSIWATLAILLSIWAVYTGIFHLLDWLTFDAVPWYIEPFTIIPVVAFSALFWNMVLILSTGGRCAGEREYD